MRTLLFEPFQGGHYTNYVEALADYHRRVLEAQGDELVIASMPSSVGSTAFEKQVKPKLGAATVDASVREVPHSIALRPTPGGVRAYWDALSSLWSSLSEAMARHRPDHLLVPSADHLTLAARLARGNRLDAVAPVRSTAVLHYGFAAGTSGVSEVFKDRIYRFGWKRAPWSRLMMVNPIQADWARTQMPSLDVEVCPDPVPLQPQTSREAALTRLNLDAARSYVGFVGAVRERAALKELVHAFLDADLGPDWRLLVAGRVEHPEHRRFLREDERVKAADDRLVVIDRFLESDELNAALRACAVIAPIYRQTQNLSANLLKAVRADRPVLTAPTGFGAYMVENFEIGTTLRYGSADASGDLRLACRSAADYAPSRRTEALKHFLLPDNFAATLFGSQSAERVDWQSVIDTPL